MDFYFIKIIQKRVINLDANILSLISILI